MVPERGSSTPPTPPIPQREGAPTAKRAQVRADVLAATERLLGEGASYAELNVERIAKAAGISRTAFYFYFADKRDLLMHLAGEVSEELYRQADIWFSGEGDPEGEIREALTRIATLYAEHGVLLRAIVEVATYDEEVAVFWRGLLARFVDASERRIAERGVPSPPRATAFALVWMTERTLYQELVQAASPPRDELVAGLAHVWLSAVYGADVHAETRRPGPARG
jgi:AcrR family transcriptional regulator